MSEPEYLYHYCSLDSFLKIIHNRTIWLSDIGKSNDSQELVWLKTECASRVDEVRREFLRTHPNLNDDILDSIYRAGSVAKGISHVDIYKTWAFCLSEERDLLSQWRGYASNGAGVVIGFKRSYLEEINTPFKDMETRFQYVIKKVDYSKEGLKTFFENSPIQKAMSSSPEQFDKVLIETTVHAAKNAAYYKNPCFAEEKEWRIAYTDTLLKFSGYGFEKLEPMDTGVFSRFPFHKMDCYAKADDIVSYIEIGIPHIEDAIHEIIIGPKAKVSTDDMKLTLVLNGLLKNINDKSILVKHSTSSYR